MAKPGKRIDNFDQSVFLSAGKDGILANETVSRCHVEDVNGRMNLSGDHVDGNVIEWSRIELDQRSTSVFSGSRLDSAIRQLILFSSFQQGTARINRIAMRVELTLSQVEVGLDWNLNGPSNDSCIRIQREGANGRSSNRIPISEREI